MPVRRSETLPMEPTVVGGTTWCEGTRFLASVLCDGGRNQTGGLHRKGPVKETLDLSRHGKSLKKMERADERDEEMFIRSCPRCLLASGSLAVHSMLRWRMRST